MWEYLRVSFSHFQLQSGLWPFLLKRSIWQNPDRLKTNQNARIHLMTTLLENKEIYSFIVFFFFSSSAVCHLSSFIEPPVSGRKSKALYLFCYWYILFIGDYEWWAGDNNDLPFASPLRRSPSTRSVTWQLKFTFLFFSFSMASFPRTLLQGEVMTDLLNNKLRFSLRQCLLYISVPKLIYKPTCVEFQHQAVFLCCFVFFMFWGLWYRLRSDVKQESWGQLRVIICLI